MFASKYRYVFIFLLAGYSYLNIRFTEADLLVSPSISQVLLIFIITLLVVLIWEGNHLISRISVHRFSSSNIYSPLLAAFIISVIWVVLISAFSSWFQTLFGFEFSIRSLKLALGFTFRVNLFLHCINVISTYHLKLRASQEAMSIAKREELNARYDALKRQISPHFLFNSLNVLDSLIKIKPSDASIFLERLAEVYRYLTLQEERDTISLRSEMDFIKSYIYLMEARFKNTLRVEIIADATDESIHIVPCTLQLVLENAIKHNEISQENPLVIEIKALDDFLIVSNKIQPKSTPSDKSGIGLANIRLRYEFMSEVKPSIVNDGSTFTVKLPLIKVD